MGVFEFEKFAKGTNDVATTLAECTAKVPLSPLPRQPARTSRFCCVWCIRIS